MCCMAPATLIDKDIQWEMIDSLTVASSASTIYHRSDSDFCYGEFVMKEIEYNCKELSSL